MEEGGNLVGSESGVVKIGTAVASALAGDSLCNFIFYNAMFGGLVGVDDWGLAEVGVVDFADGDVHVDAVEERTRELFVVSVDLVLSAGAFVSGVVEVAARAGVHGSDEHEIGRVGGLGVGARNRNLFVL